MGFVNFLRKLDFFSKSPVLMDLGDSTKNRQGNGLGGLVTIGTFIAAAAYLYVTYVSVIQGNKNTIQSNIFGFESNIDWVGREKFTKPMSWSDHLLMPRVTLATA